ncbi:MAG: hypothetical protein J2P17_26185 [Mycobacterium sp.]|nr:hypothetical protein [Mycobacterium sp.]
MPTALSSLHPIFDHKGPFAIACLDISRTTEDAEANIELRWRHLRADLERSGVDAATLGALDAVVGAKDSTPGHEGQYVAAAGGNLLLDERVPRAPRQDTSDWTGIPDLMPLFRILPPRLPYLVVYSHHNSAEVSVWTPEGTVQESVQGDEPRPDTKSSSGGWSHKRFQNAVENLWLKSAKAVAQEVEAQAVRHAVSAIYICGDVQAASVLREHLPKRVTDRITEIEGPDYEATLARLVDQAEAGQDNAVINELVEGLGRRDRAVTGIGPVTEALRVGQVETLVLLDDPSTATTLWAGPESLDIATKQSDLTDLGVPNPQEVRADMALVRAAAAADSSILITTSGPAELSQGVAATLRYPLGE